MEGKHQKQNWEWKEREQHFPEDTIEGQLSDYKFDKKFFYNRPSWPSVILSVKQNLH